MLQDLPGASRLLAPYLIEEPGLDVINPATGTLLGTVKDMGAGDVEDIIHAAKEAYPDWAGLTAKTRSNLLRNWFDLILENMDQLARIATAENGKPLAEAEAEVRYAASFIEWFAEEAKRTSGDVIPSPFPGKRILTLKQPIGVCAAITPWNFPLAMITRKAGPALAAGCPMIVKPAEATPLSALCLELLARQAGIPWDIFRVVTTTNPAEVGRVLTTHPVIRKISFTGSTAVGKQLMKQSAETVKRVSMELGGNAPLIIFDDADIDAAVTGTIASKYRNAGQTCICANRILVQSGIHDRFAEALAARVSMLKVGNGAEPETDIGPLINAAGRNKVHQLVEKAHQQGAKILFSGAVQANDGNFYPPTILTGVRPEMDIATSEIFGPVAPLIRFDTEDEAVAIANDTPYGLAAYFYTSGNARTWRVMEALEYGMVGVNETMISTEVAPFGGAKESGVGREGSRYGIDEYLELKYCLMGEA